MAFSLFCFFFQAEDGIRDGRVTGVQTCALPIFSYPGEPEARVAFPVHDSRDVEADPVIRNDTPDQTTVLLQSDRGTAGLRVPARVIQSLLHDPIDSRLDRGGESAYLLASDGHLKLRPLRDALC